MFVICARLRNGFLQVTVHPLVLLSVVDHFNRVSKTSKVKRVVGVLLGSGKVGKELDIANSFAVPFDEDEKDADVFFLDQDYLEIMYTMFHKVAGALSTHFANRCRCSP